MPVVAVAVATRNRPLRLRWLLNALVEQRVDRRQLEVVVAYDPTCQDTERVLQTHELHQAGVLHTVSFPPGRGFPGAGRNAAWRASRADRILFTDDDCRPHPDWIATMLAHAREHPGSIIQGRTLPDPHESATLFGAPWVRTLDVEPPTVWAPTCNIAYPRQLLERLGGFDPELRVGEDSDLAQRAQASGGRLIAAPDALVYHAVEERWLPGMIRDQLRWSDLAAVVKRHPALRRHLWAGVCWKREHAALLAALAGGAAAGRDRRALALCVPWLLHALPHRGRGLRGLARAASELPGRALIDLAEIIGLARGSVRHRTLML